jgi:hypothetical protein
VELGGFEFLTVYTRLITANTQFDEACAIRPRRADLRQGARIEPGCV